MDVHSSYSYIKLGLAVRLLRNASATDRKSLISHSLGMLRTAIQETRFSVSQVSLDRSQQFSDMEEAIQAIANDAEIGENLSQTVRDRLQAIEAVVFAEGCSKTVYVLPERRYRTDWLLSEPQKFLKDGDYEKLDEVARRDIASAGRCLLFGEATAAAFHILRATEAALKSYYFFYRKQKRLDKPMWANMLDQLRAKKKSPPSKLLLDSLDLIRANYRNPTQHPEALYSMDSAQDLFGVCLDSIGKMATELPTK